MAAPVDLSQSAANARKAQEQAEKEQEERENPTEPVEVTTAYLVIIGRDGQVGIHTNLEFPVKPDRPPHPDEIKGACMTIAADMTGRETAMFGAQQTINGTLNGFLQITKAMAEGQQNAQVAEAVAGEKNGTVPGQVPPAFQKG